jgi:hypothetical protein
VERGKIGGPGSSVRCERGGQASARPRAGGRGLQPVSGAGWRWGKRGRERGGQWVGRTAGGAPSVSETRSVGERLDGGPGCKFN